MASNTPLTDKAEKQSANSHSKMSRLAIQPFDDIQEEKIEWLWGGKIALGKFNLWGGNAGLNKSTLTLDIAARVTTGSPFPDGFKCSVGDVIIMSTEDDDKDTIKPRLRLAGADMSRVHAMTTVKGGSGNKGGSRLFSFVHHMGELEQAFIDYPDLKLIICDPISGFTEGLHNAFSDSDVRSMMAPVTLLLNKYRVAMIGLTHLNKNENASIIHRFTGAQAWVNVSRATWLIDRDPEDDEQRIFLPAKVNIAGDCDGYTFSTEIVEDHPVVRWGKPIIMRADQLNTHNSNSKIDEARDWLALVLGSSGVATKDLKRQAVSDGISWATIRRAKDSLNVKTGKLGFDKGWGWQLPEGHFLSPGPYTPDLSAFEENAPRNTTHEGAQAPKVLKQKSEDERLRQNPYKDSLNTTINDDKGTEYAQFFGVREKQKESTFHEGAQVSSKNYEDAQWSEGEI
jgi:hypothetical protein